MVAADVNNDGLTDRVTKRWKRRHASQFTSASSESQGVAARRSRSIASNVVSTSFV